MTHPKVFIGSSKEGLTVARRLSDLLARSKMVTPVLWNKNVFVLSRGILPDLFDTANECDFAVLVMTSDDLVTSRNKEQKAPRDNVLFELGLFFGLLGQDRTYFVFNQRSHIKLPTDLSGITGGHYEIKEAEGLTAALRPVSSKIIERIQLKGLLRHPVDRTMRELIECARSAYRIRHKVFDYHFTTWARDSYHASQSWASGQLVIRDEYNDVLLSVYSNARKNIFSTSVPAYRPVWLGDEGKQIVRTQHANKRARSTRVFIYDRKSDVTSEDIRVFREQQKNGVDVRLYFDSTRAMRFPPDLGNDWTVVDDGNVIGLTQRIDTSKKEAHWYFAHEQLRAQYLPIRDKLLENTEGVTHFLEASA